MKTKKRQSSKPKTQNANSSPSKKDKPPDILLDFSKKEGLLLDIKHSMDKYEKRHKEMLARENYLACEVLKRNIEVLKKEKKGIIFSAEAKNGERLKEIEIAHDNIRRLEKLVKSHRKKSQRTNKHALNHGHVYTLEGLNSEVNLFVHVLELEKSYLKGLETYKN